RIGAVKTDQRAVVAVGPVLRRGREVRARRVVREVTLQLEQMRIRIDERVVESALPERAPPAVVEIEPPRVATVESLKNAAQRQFLDSDQEVIVRPPPRVPEAAPATTFDLFADEVHELLPVTKVG